MYRMVIHILLIFFLLRILENKAKVKSILVLKESKLSVHNKTTNVTIDKESTVKINTNQNLEL